MSKKFLVQHSVERYSVRALSGRIQGGFLGEGPHIWTWAWDRHIKGLGKGQVMFRVKGVWVRVRTDSGGWFNGYIRALG